MLLLDRAECDNNFHRCHRHSYDRKIYIYVYDVQEQQQQQKMSTRYSTPKQQMFCVRGHPRRQSLEQRHWHQTNTAHTIKHTHERTDTADADRGGKIKTQKLNCSSAVSLGVCIAPMTGVA